MKGDGNPKGPKRAGFEVIANSVRFLPKRESRQAGAGESGTSDITPPDEITDLEPF